MKTKVFPIFSFLLLLWGCTLSMEEYVLEPEEVGFDEVAHYENEYVQINYKYRPGVKPVTKNVLEYLVESDDPNVVYFMDNIPKKWLPKEGEFLSGGCTPKTPEGLNHKVLKVTHENGLYKLDVELASEDDVFEELEVEVDFDYLMPKSDELPEVTGDMTEEERAALIYDDWSIYEGTNGINEEEETSTKKRVVGDDKDVEVMDDPNDKRTTFDVKIDTRPGGGGGSMGYCDILKKGLDTWLKSKGIDATPYLGFEIKRTDKMHHYAYHNKKTKYNKVWTETTPTYDTRLELGLDFKMADGKFPGTNEAGHWADTKKLMEYYNKHQDKVKKLKSSKGKAKVFPDFKRDTKGAIRIMVPGITGIRVVFEPSFEPIFTIGGAIGGHWKWTGDTYKEGAIEDNGKKIEINEKVKDGESLEDEFYAKGYCQAGILGRFGIGAEVAGCVTVTVGLGAEAYIEAGEDSSKPDDSDVGEFPLDTFDTVSQYVKAVVRGFVDLKVVFSPLGLFDFWETTTKLAQFNIYNKEQQITNKLVVPEYPGTVTVPNFKYHDQTGAIEYHFEYQLKALGNSLYNKPLVPMVRILDKDKKFLFNVTADGFEENEPKQLKEGTTYKFNQTQFVNNKDIPYNIKTYEAYFIPYLYHPQSGNSYIYTDLTTKISASKPDMRTLRLYKTYEGDVPESRLSVYGFNHEEFDFDNNADLWNEYRFNYDFEVENGSQMTYVGCNVKITKIVNLSTQEEQTLVEKELRLPKPKSGRYSFDLGLALRKEDVENTIYIIRVYPKFMGVSDTDDISIGDHYLPIHEGKKVDNNPGKSPYDGAEVKHFTF